MIFQTANAIDKILRHEKTQTRRIVKPDEEWVPYFDHTAYARFHLGKATGGYEIGRTYAVQSGRGEPVVMYRLATDGTSGVVLNADPAYRRELMADPEFTHKPLRIRILAIRREDVRTVSEDGARVEGYDSPVSFLIAWCMMHDKQAFPKSITPDRYWRETLLAERPANRYDAWAISFEMVE